MQDVRGTVRGRDGLGRGYLGLCALVIALFGLVFAAVLLTGWAGGLSVEAVSNIAQFAGPLLALGLCFGGSRAQADTGASGMARRQRWAARLLGLGTCSWVLGQICWTYYELVVHRAAPTPSWADAGFLGAYPLLLAGFLLLPRHALLFASRLRVVVDSLLVVVVAAIFSWYFLVGPALFQGDAPLAAKLISAAYPFGDLLLFSALLMLVIRRTNMVAAPAPQLLAAALLIVIVVDSIYSYQIGRGTYSTGTILDLGWPVEFMLVALAAGIIRAATGRSGIADSPKPPAAPGARSWRLCLPYLPLPAVAALLLHIWGTVGADELEWGVNIGAGLLLLLILLRQVIALSENTGLYRRLQATHGELTASHMALTAANGRLEALATIDPLTGLPNHRAMVAALDHELERAHHNRQPCALLFLDIDHFKALNDGYGHPAGDTVLAGFGAIVGGCLRAIDTVGRWGGEEFVVVLPQRNRAAGTAVANQVRAAVAAWPFPIGGGTQLTCSIGIAAYPQDAEERDGLIAAADRAMYAAKHLGRNQVRAADDLAVGALLDAGALSDSREEAALVGTVEALVGLVAARDHYTALHTGEVGGLAVRVALALGCAPTEVRMIGLAGRLHDVGKVAIPDAVLQKPGRLSPEEWAMMQTHPVVGANIVGRVPVLRGLAPIIRGHHERWDGAGYPDQIAGAAIPLGARILAIVDAYSAITTDRPYRAARDADWALGELRRCAGSQFDPVVVEALVRVLDVATARAADAVAG